MSEQNTNSNSARERVNEAKQILRELGLPDAQTNDRSAYTLLALLNLRPDQPWSEAQNPLIGITPIIDFIRKHYEHAYKPNTRETIRRETVHQFVAAALLLQNPDEPTRPINSPNFVYQIEPSCLTLIQSFGTVDWDKHRATYLASTETLKQRYAQERAMAQIPIQINEHLVITLSSGGQNILVQQILQEFAPRFIPGGKTLYIGDTGEKFAYFDEDAFAQLGVKSDPHGKMPDVVLHFVQEDWIVLIEAVTSHGPVNPKRREELLQLFAPVKHLLVFVTAFLDRRAMKEYVPEIAWETEVWVADHPDHLIHFNGSRFLGPYQSEP